MLYWRDLTSESEIEKIEISYSKSNTKVIGEPVDGVLSQPLPAQTDPFLMLDAFGSDKADDYIAGFPDTRTAASETVTYMIAGRMLHRDSAGHEDLLENGGVQWTGRRRGVIPPRSTAAGRGRDGRLPALAQPAGGDKMAAPWYRDFAAGELPHFTTEAGVEATVIAGAQATGSPVPSPRDHRAAVPRPAPARRRASFRSRCRRGATPSCMSIAAR